MRVNALGGGLVNGYRSFNVLGLGEDEARGLLYHHLFSSHEPGFESENREIQHAIDATEASLKTFAGPKTWVMDAGFDNDDVWWRVWGHDSHLVCRVYHFERLVEWQTATGAWEERYLDATFKNLTQLATVDTTLEVRLKGQRRAKRQSVTVHLSAVPIRVYAPGDKSRTKPVWIVQVEVEGAASDPWYLLTDWPVTTAAEALRIFRFYRRRWSVEDTFKFIKTCFGAEEVQMLHLEAIRRLVAYAWVAAGFLFHLGLTLDNAEVRLLARLGGWEPRANRPPGKLILTRGLRRLLDRLATDAILQDHLDEFGDLPPSSTHSRSFQPFPFRTLVYVRVSVYQSLREVFGSPGGAPQSKVFNLLQDSVFLQVFELLIQFGFVGSKQLRLQFFFVQGHHGPPF